MENGKRMKRELDTGSHRDWSELPNLLLVSILGRLPSIADFSAFSGVCRWWRSQALSNPQDLLRHSRPPLILRPILQRSLQSRKWKNPARCQLVSPIYESKSYWCKISSATLRCSYISSSFGNLIFLTGCRVLIADVCTGGEILPPILPGDARLYTRRFLTAPPSSPDCRLLMSGFGSSLLCWRVGDHEWTEISVGHHVQPPIYQVVPFKGRLHALDYGGRLLTIRFSPQLSVEGWEEDYLERTGTSLPVPIKRFAGELVECDGELLQVYFDDRLPYCVNFEVYRLDSSAASWVKVESLGDWSLFMDAWGRGQAVSCMKPVTWGGMSNCIYISGLECDTWTVLPFDGPPLNFASNETPYSLVNMDLKSWPSSLWVYPSKLF